MGDRKRPRTKMVLPVRVWGMDSAGKPFNVLAYTLDISSSGARLGGVRVPLSVGEAVTLQYKQQRALFKVAWVGRPGEKTHEQVGIYTLEPDKHVWLEIPEPPQFVDSFESKAKAAGQKKAPAPEPVPPTPPESPPPTPPASLKPGAAAGKPASAAADKGEDLNARLKASARELRQVDELVKHKPTDPKVLHDFREALSKVRQTTWAIQQWQELNQESAQPFPLLWYVNSERLRFVVQAVEDLWKDVTEKGIEIDETLLGALFETIEMVKTRYAKKAKGASQAAIDLTDESHHALSEGHGGTKMVEQVSAMRRHVEQGRMEVDAALHYIAVTMQRIVGADGFSIAVADRGEMVITASIGVAPEAGMVVDTESGLGAEAVSSKKYVYCRDTQHDPRVDAESCAAAGIGSVLMFPMCTDAGVTMAMFEVSAEKKNAFGDEHVAALKAAAVIVQGLLASEASLRK